MSGLEWERGRWPWVIQGPYSRGLVSGDGVITHIIFWVPARLAKDGETIISFPAGLWWVKVDNPYSHELAVETEDPTAHDWARACEITEHE